MSESNAKTTLGQLEGELGKLPSVVLQEYEAAKEKVSAAFNDDELVLWSKEGLSIANQTVRSWEVAAEYFRSAPDVAAYLPFSSFMQWARCGSYLAQE